MLANSRTRAAVTGLAATAGVFAFANPVQAAPQVLTQGSAAAQSVLDQYPLTAQEEAEGHISIVGGDPGEQITGTVTVPPDKCGVKDPEAAALLCTYSFSHRNNPQPAAGASIARKRKLLKLSAKAAQAIGSDPVVVQLNGSTVSDLTVKAPVAATRAINPTNHGEMWDYILFQKGPFQLYLQNFNLAWYDWDYAWMNRQRRGVVGYHRCQSGPNFGYDVTERRCTNNEGSPGTDAWVDGTWNVSVLNKNISNNVERWMHDHTYNTGVQRWVSG